MQYMATKETTMLFRDVSFFIGLYDTNLWQSAGLAVVDNIPPRGSSVGHFLLLEP